MQADSSTARKFGGTGLGLALSRRIAKSMGGDLVLEYSTIGAESSFLIAIPHVPAKVQAKTPIVDPAKTQTRDLI